jgi:uncharacterized membrane protein YgdD (TMEM256/DUF423 family)
MQLETYTIKYLKIASFMMALGIGIGAFGAHGLAPYLDEYGNIIYNKGTSYWFYNTAGLFAIAFMTYLFPKSTKLQKGFWFVIIGTFIFSISLFILALTHIKILGAITPIGGTAMIIGWVLVVLGLKK